MRKRTFSLLTLRKIQNNILISELWKFSLISRSYPQKIKQNKEKQKQKSSINFEKRDFHCLL